MIKYSRKRFQEALRACKEVAKNSRLPASQRLRAAELIYLLYGGELPGGNSKRDKRTIKDLVQERSVEKQIRSAVDEQTKQQTEAEEPDRISVMLAEFLKPTQVESVVSSTTKAEPAEPAQAPTKAEERDRRRWLHALRVAADATLTDRHRIAAIIRIQAALPEVNSLKNVKPSVLLHRILPPWAERTYLKNGRHVELAVSRPQPVSIADLWG